MVYEDINNINFDELNFSQNNENENENEDSNMEI